MKKENPAKAPIISVQMRQTLLNTLMEVNPTYYHVTKIIMETGCPLKFLRDMTCGSIRKSPKLIYVLKRASSEWEETIPQDTYDNLLDFIKSKDDHMPLFSARRPEQSMHQSSYLRTLDAVSYRLGFQHALTVQSLRMCYVYDLVKKDGNVTRAKAYLKAHSKREVYEALHIDPSADKLVKTSPLSSFYRTNDIVQLREDINDILRNCIYKMEDVSSLKEDEAARTLRLFDSLRHAIDVYRDTPT